ncbi:MAG: hypothetical protein QXS20_11030 [Candidatus Thorarchaeota archaeon]
MSDEATYVRAKLTEIHGAIGRLTDMLDKMVEVLSKMSRVSESLEDIALRVTANGEKIDELAQLIRSMGQPEQLVQAKMSPGDRATMSSAVALMDTLDTQIREGAIASDLEKKIDEAADMLEQKPGTAGVVVKMRRWVRILRTYNRVDPITPSDLTKLKSDLREWQKELSQIR